MTFPGHCSSIPWYHPNTWNSKSGQLYTQTNPSYHWHLVCDKWVGWYTYQTGQFSHYMYLFQQVWKKILTWQIVVLLWTAILPTCFPPFMCDLIAPSPIFDRSISLLPTVHNVFRFNQFLYCSFESHWEMYRQIFFAMTNFVCFENSQKHTKKPQNQSSS